MDGTPSFGRTRTIRGRTGEALWPRGGCPGLVGGWMATHRRVEPLENLLVQRLQDPPPGPPVGRGCGGVVATGVGRDTLFRTPGPRNPPGWRTRPRWVGLCPVRQESDHGHGDGRAPDQDRVPLGPVRGQRSGLDAQEGVLDAGVRGQHPRFRRLVSLPLPGDLARGPEARGPSS